MAVAVRVAIVVLAAVVLMAPAAVVEMLSDDLVVAVEALVAFAAPAPGTVAKTQIGIRNHHHLQVKYV